MRNNLVSCQDMELQIAFCFETVTGEIFCKKQEFVMCVCRFVEGF